jgi:dynein heavy chain
VDILAAVDDIHMMLDDNILKAQTMRGSPYVKAFESEMQAWETKLISMQDILDAWLEVITTQMALIYFLFSVNYTNYLMVATM